MRQSDHPAGLLRELRGLSGVDDESAYVPSPMERIQELKKQTNGAVCKLPAKKALANRFVKLKRAIYDDVKSADPTESTNLKERLDQIFNAWRNPTAIRGMCNDTHSKMLVMMMDIVDVIVEHLKDRAADIVATRTRGGSRVGNQDPKQILYSDLQAIQRKTDRRICEALNNNPDLDNILKGLPLPASMVGRQFDPTRVPSDPALQRCPFCNHRGLNTVPEDDGLEERNAAQVSQYDDLMRIWNGFVQAREATNNAGEPPPSWPTNPYKNNKEMKRAPSKPSSKTLESPRLLCTCLHAFRLNEFSDVENTCISQCRQIDDDDDRHLMLVGQDPSLPVYPWENGRPTCPICRCKCNKLFYIKDIPRITLALLRPGRSALMKRGPTPQEEIGNFLGRCMHAGMQAMNDVGAIQEQHRTNDIAAGRPVSSVADVPPDVFFGAAAENAVRTADNLSSDAVQHLQDKFGRKTDVTLPDGGPFDTRRITANSNAHSRNNRIPIPGQSTNTVARGMVDRLKIDYSNLSTQFKTASLNPSNLSNAVTELGNRLFTPDANAAMVSSAEATDTNRTDEPQDDGQMFAVGLHGAMTLGQYKAQVRANSKNWALSSDGYLQPRQFGVFDSDGVKPPKNMIDPNGEDAWRLGMDEDELDAVVEKSFYESLKDHGGKCGPVKNEDGDRGGDDDLIDELDNQDPDSTRLFARHECARKSYSSKRRRKKIRGSRRIPAPAGWPFPPPTTKCGGERIFDRIMGANAQNHHSKLRKRDLSGRQVRDRVEARKTSAILIAKSNQAELVGNSIAQASGVGMSQISQYADGKLADRDGDFFSSQEALKHFKRMNTSQSSSDSE